MITPSRARVNTWRRRRSSLQTLARGIRMANQMGAASKIQAAFRGFRARKRSSRGSKKVKNVRSRVTAAAGSGVLHQSADYARPGLNGRTLGVLSVDFPPMVVGVVSGGGPVVLGQYNYRKSQTVFFSGIKVCNWFKNLQSFPIVIHTALLQLKDYHPADSNEPADFENDFFRDAKAVNQRNKPFTDALTVWDSDYYCAAINPDKFNILSRRKYHLAGVGETRGHRLSYTSDEKYYKIGKNVAFETVTAVQPTHPFYYVYWAVAENPQDWTSAGTLTYDAYFSEKVYWRSKGN